jgi:hypothetical protein
MVLFKVMDINDFYFVYNSDSFVDSSWQIFIEIIILNKLLRMIIIIVIIITIYKYYPDICRGFTLCYC